MTNLNQRIRAHIDELVMHPASTWRTLNLADAIRAVLDIAPHLGSPNGIRIRETIATQLGITTDDDEPATGRPVGLARSGGPT